MADDVDIDCSGVLADVGCNEMGGRVFDLILSTASGEKSASEKLSIGEHEWVPWVPGAMF
jgi:altronate hydrolase